MGKILARRKQQKGIPRFCTIHEEQRKYNPSSGDPGDQPWDDQHVGPVMQLACGCELEHSVELRNHFSPNLIWLKSDSKKFFCRNV